MTDPLPRLVEGKADLAEAWGGCHCGAVRFRATLAQGLALNIAVQRALVYVQEAIRTAPGLGQGRGPLHHGHTVRPWNG